MHINTIHSIHRRYKSFNIPEVLKFFESDKNLRQGPHQTMHRILNFYTKYLYSCYDLTSCQILDIHEKLCVRFDSITHQSVIDKSLFDILSKSPEDSDKFYYDMCISKTNNMVKTLKENPDFAKVGDKAALIRRYGEVEGIERYESFRETQRLSSKRSLKYWLSLGLSNEDAREELRKFQTKFSLSICIEKYGLVEGKEIWEDRQDRWQETLNSKPQAEIDAINSKKSNMLNTSRYGDNDAILYLITLPNNHIKVGITNKNSIYNRYTELQLAGCVVSYDQKYKGSIANTLELLIKEEYSDNIIHKAEHVYLQFGYTETIKGVPIKTILHFIEELTF